METLAMLFSSRGKAEIFRLLYGSENRELYLRELARKARMSASTVMQELHRLASFGMVVARKDGNRTYYSSNSAHPLYAEIRSLVRKTSFTEILRNALGTEGIGCAFVFGSMARGGETSESDVDVLIVGSITLREVAKRLSGVGLQLGREVNPVIFNPQEFSKRLRTREHFVSTVMKGEKLVLIGNLNEFERVGK
jgi:predicted nucleotidyltransferase